MNAENFIIMASGNKGLKVNVPSCLSFMAFGLKDMSLALTTPANEIKITMKPEGGITVFSGSQKNAFDKSYKEKITGILEKFLDFTGVKAGLDIHFVNKIPFDVGMGATEAHISGMIYAVNDLLGIHLPKEKQLEFVLDASTEFSLDILPSHVAAQLYGGIILYNKNLTVPVQKIYSPAGIGFSLIYTGINDIDENYLFKDKNSVLNHTVNIASLIKGLIVSGLDLIADSLKARKYHFENFFYWYEDLKRLALENGAYATGFGHKGQTAFILHPNSLIRSNVDEKMIQYFNKNKLNLKFFDADIDLNGIFKY